MAKFQVGDRVVGNAGAGKYGITKKGWMGTVEEINKNSVTISGFDVDPECFDLLESKTTKKMSKILDTFAILTKGEPEKSFIRSGVTNIDGSFTEDGWKMFKMWLLKKNGDLFLSEVVTPILEEMKKDCK